MEQLFAKLFGGLTQGKPQENILNAFKMLMQKFIGSTQSLDSQVQLVSMSLQLCFTQFKGNVNAFKAVVKVICRELPLPAILNYAQSKFLKELLMNGPKKASNVADDEAEDQE